MNHDEEARRNNLLRWILREWNCKTLEEAKEKAQGDCYLEAKLSEAGVVLNDSKS